MKDPNSSRDIGPRAGTPLWLYMAATIVAGMLLLTGAALGSEPAQYLGQATEPLTWVLIAMVVLGELRPVAAPGQAPGNGSPTSLPFSLALVVVQGLPLALLAQVLAVAVAGTARGHAVHRIAFNAAQYVLCLGAADAVLRLVLPVLRDSPWVPAGEVIIALALAGAVHFAVNRILVRSAVAMHERSSLGPALLKDIRGQIRVTCVLVALVPLVVVAATHSVLYVPLFALPLGALYSSAMLSVKRDHQANHDELTGLANRKLLNLRARSEMDRAGRRGGRIGLLLLDLDRFKEVNDTLGHPAGDRLLQTVARRLSHSVRPGDLVARLGGDEFAVLLTQVRDSAAAAEVAARLRCALAEPVRIDGMDLDLGASIGIALFPDDADSFEHLLQRADVAMYVAKSARSGVESYDPGKDRNSTARLSLYSELRRGLAEGALEMHYQPRVSLDDGRVTGLEALARWQHPTRGLLLPEEFMPVVEQSNLFRAFTGQVLDITLARVSRWREEGLTPTVAVNLGMRELLDPRLPDTVDACLREHGVPPSQLVLEIGEDSLADDGEAAAAAVHRLRELGVGLALDDFGTGHFTLVQLAELPLDEVRIHESFTARLTDEAGTAAVHAAVALVNSLGMDATAEGVRTRELAAAAREAGCRTGQGSHYSHPLRGDEVPAWIAAHSGGSTAGTCA
ncbi:putative bifunctional diguanylate cyclase/phosphodiesterase [Nocardiopsis algeriensis]|uniref:putative bifunctional diguanylate cyclase/phosphodiesterase n=1 Tax=Nocardiopsis algeriensis TaxID=1478215 RepID=UPI003B4290A2